MNSTPNSSKTATRVSGFMTRQEIRSLRLAFRMMRLKGSNVALAVFLGALTLVCAIGLSVVAAWMIARASQPDALWMDLALAAVCVRMFGIGRALFRYLERLASHKVALLGVANLRHTTYQILANRPTKNIAALRRGEILARTGGDVDSVGDFVVKSVMPALITAVTGLGTVILFAFYSPLAALALAACLLLAGVVGPMLTIRSARIAELASQQAQIELSGSAQTLLMSAPELSVSGRLTAANAHLDRIEQSIQALKDRAARPAAIASFIDNFAMGLAVLSGFLIGTPLVLSGQLWDVNLAILVLGPLAAFEGTAQLAPAAVQLVSSGASAARLIDLMGGTAEVENMLTRLENEDESSTTTVVMPSADSQPATAEPCDIEPVLVAKDLAIGWPGGPVVARGINLELRPGKALAVVGQSGIGKSTLLYTLTGLIQPVSGTLTLGGHPLTEIPREKVAATIIMTAEDAHVFQTSVLENIRVSRANVGAVEAEKLAMQAGMGAWLRAAPQGLETPLGLDGAALSGGERRRILLARALASPAQLLALDEPGEHLDGKMADQLVGDLLTAGKSGARGVLLVTHRLSALGAADEVLVMSKPTPSAATEVIARGTHAELIENLAEYSWAWEQEKTYV